MWDAIMQIAALSLTVFALVFYLVGFLVFRAARLTSANSISACGKLVGFRKYYATDQWGDNSVDHTDNKAGRVPIIEIKLDGENVAIAAAAANYTLTGADIGKQVKVRYRRFIGVRLVIDEDKSIEKYNQLRNVLFWIFIGVATILLFVGIASHFYLQHILGNTKF
jgi:hypothetical protein